MLSKITIFISIIILIGTSPHAKGYASSKVQCRTSGFAVYHSSNCRHRHPSIRSALQTKLNKQQQQQQQQLPKVSLYASSSSNDEIVTTNNTTTTTTTTTTAASKSSSELIIDTPSLTTTTKIVESAQGECLTCRTPQQRRKQTSTQQNQQQRLINQIIAILAFILALGSYTFRLSHPISSLELLTSMQSKSASIQIIGHNHKPTMIDFWAPWCENCRLSASTLYSIEQEYNDRINFIMINADDDSDDGMSWSLIERFGVDAIPHLALISSEGDVETALIGPIPQNVLRADLDVLLQNSQQLLLEDEKDNNNEAKMIADQAAGTTTTTTTMTKKKVELPYKMFDAFQNRPEQRRVSF